MLISRRQVVDHLGRFLMGKDLKLIPSITDMCWAAYATMEFGFECPAEQQEEMKEKFFNLVENFSNAREEAGTPVSLKEYGCEPAFPFEHQPTVEDLSLVCDVFHKLAVQEGKVSKELLLDWLKEAWDAGMHQQRVYSMQVEGGVMNEYGRVTIFGAELAMFGKSKGLLPS